MNYSKKFHILFQQSRHSCHQWRSAVCYTISKTTYGFIDLLNGVRGPGITDEDQDDPYQNEKSNSWNWWSHYISD